MASQTIVVLTCGHEKDYTGETVPAVGDEHSCWSSCDQVPTWRGANNPNICRVARIETRDEE